MSNVARVSPVSRLARAAALALSIALLSLLPAAPVAAHPLGNFSVNQYTRVDIGPEEARLFYVLDLAELPTVADNPLLDADDDGIVSEADRSAYLSSKLAEIIPALHLSHGTSELPLTLTERSLAFVPGQAGLDTTRIEAVFTAALPASTGESGEIRFRNDYASDRLGWGEIVVTNGENIRIDEGLSLATDRSSALRTYPDDLLGSPLDERSVAFRYADVAGAPVSNREPAPLPVHPLGIGQRLEVAVNGATLSTGGLLLALLAAAGWGALHALSPGHGKTVVGAYLVGSRGTPRHALFLGLTVTITHTAGVIALGLIVLFASRSILPEQLYPWLSLVSGLLVVTLGLIILRQRVLGLSRFGHHHAHGHDHGHGADPEFDAAHAYAHAHGLAHSHGGHTHTHRPPGAEGERVTWRSLLALGVSGGLLPCPSALLALLGAVAIGRAGFGLLVVLAFSLGLAATLTGVGLLFLYAGRVLERQVANGPWSAALRFAPAIAALAVTASGLLLVARAVVELQTF